MRIFNGEKNGKVNKNGLEVGNKFLFNALTALDFVADSVKNDDRYKEVMDNLSKCNTIIDTLKLENDVNS